MGRIVLLRHAKAVRPEAGLEDFDRELTPRGRAEAQSVARLLHDLGVAPDRALVSPARRTQETWSIVGPALGDPPAEKDQSFYLADEDAWLARLENADAKETVIVVGHNPGLKHLAQALMGRGPHDARAREQLAQGLPTSCALILACAEHPAPGAARLVGFVTPPRADAAS
ncbi:MAG: histidine phosphatase family protein [Maricaulaceae bacterium]|jgi:phosphohistidine phosphatase